MWQRFYFGSFACNPKIIICFLICLVHYDNNNFFIKEDGLKYKEVADILTISIKTVEHQMSIALEKLKLAIQSDTAQAYLSNPQRIFKN